jgi:hypothetical protein
MKYVLAVMVTGFALAMANYPSITHAQTPSYPCPTGAVSCKIVVMTPDEEKTLTQAGGIFDQASWANRSGMDGLITAWKQKLATAPAGTVAKPEEKKPDPASTNQTKK